MKQQETKAKYYKSKYYIVFYDSTGEDFIDIFDNVREICNYRGLAVTQYNIKLLTEQLIYALKKDDHSTKMLDGKTVNQVFLVDIEEEK